MTLCPRLWRLEERAHVDPQFARDFDQPTDGGVCASFEFSHHPGGDTKAVGRFFLCPAPFNADFGDASTDVFQHAIGRGHKRTVAVVDFDIKGTEDTYYSLCPNPKTRNP